MFYGYGYNYSYLIYMLPALLFAFYASHRVSSSYNKYCREKSQLGLSGQEVARRILLNNGIKDIAIVKGHGQLTDHYDSTNSRISLSEEVFFGTSIASIAVAAHEASHAVQLEEGYLPLKIRHSLVGITQIASNASYFLILLGMFVNTFFAKIGILLYMVIFIFQVVTLPVEYNASSRAINELSLLGAGDSDISSSRAMLKAAALTYLAAMLTSLAEVLRLISIFGDRRDE